MELDGLRAQPGPPASPRPRSDSLRSHCQKTWHLATWRLRVTGPPQPPQNLRVSVSALSASQRERLREEAISNSIIQFRCLPSCSCSAARAAPCRCILMHTCIAMAVAAAAAMDWENRGSPRENRGTGINFKTRQLRGQSD